MQKCKVIILYLNIDLTYSHFSHSSDHQLPLHPDDYKTIAFEANGKFLKFKRIPFGLTNAVGAFQRVVTQIINEDKFTGIYPYLDDVTVAGNTFEEL